MRNLNKAKAIVVMVVAALGLSGCATMSDGEVACLMSAIGGAVVGAMVHEDEKEGALIGATIGAMGCSIYRYLSEKQAAEMVERENAHLSSVPPEQPINASFSLAPVEGSTEGPTVRLHADPAVAANTLLGEEQGEYEYCRRTRSLIRPAGDDDVEPSVHEHVKCLNAEGDWEIKTSTT